MCAKTLYSAPMGLEKSKLSFLDLPGEIRNTIYAQAFVFPDSLLILALITTIDSDQHYKYDVEDNGCGHVDGWPFDFKETVTLGTGDLIRGSLDALVLLILCRQVYHEAALVFYKDNTFIISHIGSIECENMFYTARYEYHDPSGLRIMSHAAALFEKLGNQTNFLRKVQSDVGTLRPATCGSRTNTNVQRLVDITPIWCYYRTAGPRSR
ncbi:hypothetical protein BU23DRAFT_568042 [Bimuria novae-zelandiae CBS 107.79]|uniref:DUF7730 domain-containing protein n=1 Tax=Bimuria novae-zelandiae CBS 107.79 TaxID=1447943 RepID=A0A6A5VBC4_9PLEO|nr:hypothetical protein BU23DRAFT_568042 [Bimuria novae-zelandiae CBS 107.79]